MDWRNRKYYLVLLSTRYREDKIKNLKDEIPSFKMHSPYRHHKKAVNKTTSQDQFDCTYFDFFCEAMVGCDVKDAELLEDRLREPYCKYKEITKEMCGQ